MILKIIDDVVFVVCVVLQDNEVEWFDVCVEGVIVFEVLKFLLMMFGSIFLEKFNGLMFCGNVYIECGYEWEFEIFFDFEWVIELKIFLNCYVWVLICNCWYFVMFDGFQIFVDG